MIFTDDGQEWAEVTNHLDIANQRRVFVRGKTIDPSTIELALLRERCFQLAEDWSDIAEPRNPQYFAAELKRILT